MTSVLDFPFLKTVSDEWVTGGKHQLQVQRCLVVEFGWILQKRQEFKASLGALMRKTRY